VFFRTIHALHKFVESIVLLDETFNPILEILLSNGHVAESIKAYTDIVTLAVEYNRRYTSKLENIITQMSSLTYTTKKTPAKQKGKKK
jgi:hypothetical protein